jgi:hypothetical protein
MFYTIIRTLLILNFNFLKIKLAVSYCAIILKGNFKISYVVKKMVCTSASVAKFPVRIPARGLVTTRYLAIVFSQTGKCLDIRLNYIEGVHFKHFQTYGSQKDVMTLCIL